MGKFIANSVKRLATYLAEGEGMRGEALPELDLQRAAIADWITVNDVQAPIVREYVDTSAERAADRPVYQEMLRDARAGKFSHVVIEGNQLGDEILTLLNATYELNRFGVTVLVVAIPDAVFEPVHSEWILVEERTLGACEFDTQETAVCVVVDEE